MLKYEDFISKLSKNEKLNILTNFSSFKRLSSNEAFQDLNTDISLENLVYKNITLPSLGSVVSSFDDELIKKYCYFLGYVAQQNNIKLAMSPNLSVLNFDNGISGEALLNYKTLNYFAEGNNSFGVVPLINYFDDNCDFIYQNEVYHRRYLDIILGLNKNYESNPFILYDSKGIDKISDECNKVVELGYDHLFMSTYGYILQSKNNISLNKGRIFNYSGTDDTIDQTLDLLLDQLLKEPVSTNIDFPLDQFVNELVYKSSVVLKNEGIVPVNDLRRIAVIQSGSALSNEKIEEVSKYVQLDFYNALSEINQFDYDLYLYVIENNTDVKKVESEIATLKSGENNNLKVAVSIATNKVINTRFDKDCDFLMKSYSFNNYTIEPLVNILIGKELASGKLNFSYPVDTIEMISNKELKLSQIKYPFGYSAPALKIEYSDIEYDQNKITMVATNNNFQDGVDDVIQIYLEDTNELKDSNLICYKRVHLNPGESKKISIVLTSDMLKRFTAINRQFESYKGVYIIHVNNSLTDNLKDFKILANQTKQEIIDANSKDSVTKDSFTFERPFKSNVLGYYINVILSGLFIFLYSEIFFSDVWLILSIFTIITALVSFVKLCGDISKLRNSGNVPLYNLGKKFLIYTVISAVAIAIASIADFDFINNYPNVMNVFSRIIFSLVFIGTGGYLIFITYKKYIITIENKESLIDVEGVYEFREAYEAETEEMITFTQLTKNEKTKEVEVEEVETPTINNQIFYIKKEKDLIKVYDDLYKFITEKGLIIDEKEYKELFISLCYSRLIFVKNNDKELLTKLVDVLNEFFNGFKNNNDKDYRDILYFAKDNPNSLYFTTISDVKNVILEINEDIKYNTKAVNINLNGRPTRIYKNIWYIIDYDEFDYSYFDYNNSIVNINLKVNENSESSLDVITLNVYLESLISIVDELTDTYYLDEQLCKKFDDLEEYLNHISEFKFTNKINNYIEHYVALNLLFGFNLEETVDNLFANNLVIYMFSYFNEKINKEELMNKLEELFCEEYLENTYDVVSAIEFKEINEDENNGNN